MTAEDDVYFGEFRYDFSRKELYRGGALVNLQPQAVSLLDILLRRANVVVSKQEICREIWPANVVDYDQRVRSLIRDLRSELCHDETAPLIETFPRKGYRFNLPPQAASSTAPVTPLRRYAVLAASLAILFGVAISYFWIAEAGREPTPDGVSLAVYEDYLRARKILQANKPGDRQRAIALFEKVTAAAPEYSPGYSGLARAYGLGRQKAKTRQLIEDALRVDPDNAEAFFLRGQARLFVDIDLSGGADLERAHKLEPDDTEYAAMYGVFLNATGRVAEARAIADQIRIEDILAPRTFADLGFIYIRAGEPETAIGYCRQALELGGAEAIGQHCLLQAALRSGDEALASEAAGELFRLRFGDAPLDQSVLDIPDKFARYWRAMTAEYAAGRAQAMEGAFGYAMMGDKERALAAIREALANKETSLIFMRATPYLASIRGEADFEAIAESVGLPTAAPAEAGL